MSTVHFTFSYGDKAQGKGIWMDNDLCDLKLNFGVRHRRMVEVVLQLEGSKNPEIYKTINPEGDYAQEAWEDVAATFLEHLPVNALAKPFMVDDLAAGLSFFGSMLGSGFGAIINDDTDPNDPTLKASVDAAILKACSMASFEVELLV